MAVVLHFLEIMRNYLNIERVVLASKCKGKTQIIMGANKYLQLSINLMKINKKLMLDYLSNWVIISSKIIDNLNHKQM